MKRFVIVLLLALLLSGSCWAARPPLGEEAWITPTQAAEGVGGYTSSGADAPPSPRGEGYSDAEINEIANVVDGEVGGIGGASVVMTYADGSQMYTDGYTLRRIHACVVDNQVKSGLFPATVDGCVRQCWSTSYASTGWRDSSQWRSCRQAVVDALGITSSALRAPSPQGEGFVPENVFAATCDAGFAAYYAGWRLWARVDWDTGWVSGTFYYYCYG